MKINVKLPDSNVNKFRLKIPNHKGRRFLRASGLLNSLEKALAPQRIKEKICVRVKYDVGYINETLNSNNVNYLLWTTMCFLEDYLSKDYIRDINKKYG